jgi:diguanylate cyclase (GGDEF)-like protein/PAS domain S-box-containing protein
VLANRAARVVREASSRQEWFSDCLARLDRVLISLNDAETGQRGYLLTGEDRYLAPYQSAAGQVARVLDELPPLPVSNPAAAELTAVRILARLKLLELEHTLQLYSEGKKAAALAEVRAGSGENYMEQLRGHIAAAASHLTGARDQMSAQVATATSRSERLNDLTVAVLIVSVLLAAAQIGTLWCAQRRYESALRASEHRHRTIVEEQSELVALCTSRGALTYINPAFARFLNQASNSIHGREIFSSVDPEQRDACRKTLESVASSGEAASQEVRVRNGEGQYRWIAWRHRLQANGGTGVLIHSIGRDVTARREAEEKLQDREGFLTRTGHMAGIGGWQLDLRSGEIYWSDQVKRIHEVPLDYVPDVEQALRFFSAEVRPLISNAVELAVKKGKSWDMELPLTTLTGRQRWVRTVGELEAAPDGTPLRLTGALQDISERKMLEHRLAASERFLRTVTDNIPVILTYLDQSLQIQFANRLACEDLGASKADLLGKNLGEIVKISDDALLKRLAEAFTSRPQRFERVADATGRCVEMQLIPDVGDDGQVQGVFSLGADITHLKLIERNLRDLTDVFDATSDFVAQTDRWGKLLYLNPAARRVVGFAAHRPINGHFFAEFYTEKTNARFLSEIVPAVKRSGVWLGETEVRLPAGDVLPVNHMVIAHRDSNARIARFTSIMRDISVEVEARQALEQQTATLTAVLEAIPAMVAVCGEDGRYRLVNRAFERWRGVERSALIGRTVEEVIGAAAYQEMLPFIHSALAGETVVQEREFPDAQESRYIAMTYVPLRCSDEMPAGFIEIAQDITHHREEHTRLRLISERDPLTGLLNRAGFETYLRQKYDRGDAATLAVLYIDLDYFKPINDRYGHTSGDEVLRMFGERLQAIVRPTDAVARVGGDEFAVGLVGVREAEHAATIAEKVVRTAEEPFQVGHLMLRIGASVGLAWRADSPGGWRGLVERADGFLYQAKAAGRGRQAGTEASTTASSQG